MVNQPRGEREKKEQAPSGEIFFCTGPRDYQRGPSRRVCQASYYYRTGVEEMDGEPSMDGWMGGRRAPGSLWGRRASSGLPHSVGGMDPGLKAARDHGVGRVCGDGGWVRLGPEAED